MKTVNDVFPPDLLNPMYELMKIHELETHFGEMIDRPNENFFCICFIVHALSLRFLNAEKFFKGSGYKNYLKDLEQKRNLEKEARNKPGVQSKQVIIDLEEYIVNAERVMKELELTIKDELKNADPVKVPHTFAEYAKLKRLKYKDGAPVKAQLIQQIKRIADEIDKFPYLYDSLSKTIGMFDSIPKVVRIPKLLILDSVDQKKNIDSLVEDDEYFQHLFWLIKSFTVDRLDDYISQDQFAREKYHRQSKQIAAEQKIVKNPRELDYFIRVDGTHILGDKVILNYQEFILVRDNPELANKLKTIVRNYVKTRTIVPENEGRFISPLFVDETAGPDMIFEVKKLIEETRIERSIPTLETKYQSEDPGTATNISGRHSVKNRQLFAGEYSGSIPIEDD